MSPTAKRPRVLVTANFFGESDPRTLQILTETGAEIIFRNDHAITEDEVAGFIEGSMLWLPGSNRSRPRSWMPPPI